MSVGRISSTGVRGDFSKICWRGPKVAKFVFSHSKLKFKPFIAKVFKIQRGPSPLALLFNAHDHTQGRRNIGRAGAAVKKLRAMEIYEKNRYQLCFLLFNNNVDLKNNKRNYRKFVSIRS